jgi:glycosyltransferase involved in cell wall biosynthesis
VQLSVVIPAYNEGPALRAGKLDAVRAWMDDQPRTAELIVVDDGSEDDTADLAAGAADRVVRIAHAGKAAAIIAGVEAAAGEIVLFTDMDQATPIVHARGLLDALDAGADVAIGSRGLSRPGAPPGRRLLSWGQVALRSALLGLAWPDTQCGFKAFSREAALDVLSNLRLYGPRTAGLLRGPSVASGFDVEFLFVARRRGYRVAAVPVTWRYADTRRVALGRDALRGVRDLLAIAGARWKGAYGRAASRPEPGRAILGAPAETP